MTESVRLWSGEIPGYIDGADVPTLHYYAAKKKRGDGCVVIFPGGGYINFCQREADPVAFQFMAAGYNAFILKYSLGADAVYPNPLLDLCQAMKMIRENSEEWGIIEDQIAVCGFSAGGHLAASLGV